MLIIGKLSKLGGMARKLSILLCISTIWSCCGLATSAVAPAAQQGAPPATYRLDAALDAGELGAAPVEDVARAEAVRLGGVGVAGGLADELHALADATYGEAFPDANFRAAVLELLNADGGGRTGESLVSEADISAMADIINLSVPEMGIADLTGIEYFVGLIIFDCHNNQLTSLDLSNNVELEMLDCFSNLITELDLSNNAALRIADCSANQLTWIDVSGCINLMLLDCTTNRLTKLDMSKNHALVTLCCSYNYISSPSDVAFKPELQLAINSPEDPKSGQFQFYPQNEPLVSVPPNITTEALPDGTVGVAYSQEVTAVGDEPITWNLAEGALPDGLALTQDGAILGTPDAAGAFSFTVRAANEAGYDDMALSIKIDTLSATTYADAFPDENFRAAVLGLLNAYGGARTGESPVTDEDIAAMATRTDLEVYNRGISDLTGIEYFTGLVNLYCYNNELTELDVAGNAALRLLNCGDNRLDKLDVAGNTVLKSLYCYNNELHELDVTNNTALETLYCYNNLMVELDVSNNSALIDLHCNNNQLVKLDVSKNADLGFFYCADNHFVELDVSNNSTLAWLICSGNQLTGLDVTKNTALIWLNCDNNRLAELDVSKNIALVLLSANHNQLVQLDVSGNAALMRLYCSFNNMSSPSDVVGWSELGLGINSPEDPNSGQFRFYPQNEPSVDMPPEITTESLPDGAVGVAYSQEVIAVGDLPITWSISEGTLPDGLELTQDGAILGTPSAAGTFPFRVRATNEIGYNDKGLSIRIDALSTTTYADAFPDENFRAFVLGLLNVDGGGRTGESLISEADYKAFTEQMTLDVSNNNIADLTGIEYFTELTELVCPGNQLAELDLSNNAELSVLKCNGNRLANLDVSNNTKLSTLWCNENRLLKLDVSNCSLLTELGCAINRLAELDVSGNAALKSLSCTNNPLEELDVSNCVVLENLTCNGNWLGELDLLNNVALKELNCDGNQLAMLVLSNNDALTKLNCDNNMLVELDLSNNNALTELECGSNLLVELDLPLNPVLTSIMCSNNKLTKLHVASCVALTFLDCSYNYMQNPDDVDGWKLIELEPNTEEQPNSGTFRFYPQNPIEPPTPTPVPPTPTPPVTGTRYYTVVPTTVDLTSAGTGAFTITVPGAAAPYAEIQYLVQIPFGVMIDSISFNQPVSVLPLSKIDDSVLLNGYSFGCFSTTNSYTADMVCTINLTYTDTASATIGIAEIQQFWIISAGIVFTDILAGPNAVILEPYATPTPTPVPPTPTPTTVPPTQTPTPVPPTPTPTPEPPTPTPVPPTPTPVPPTQTPTPVPHTPTPTPVPPTPTPVPPTPTPVPPTQTPTPVPPTPTPTPEPPTPTPVPPTPTPVPPTQTTPTPVPPTPTPVPPTPTPTPVPPTPTVTPTLTPTPLPAEIDIVIEDIPEDEIKIDEDENGEDVYTFVVYESNHYNLHFKSQNPYLDDTIYREKYFINLKIDDEFMTRDVDYEVYDGSVKITLLWHVLNALAQARDTVHKMELEFEYEGNRYTSTYNFNVDVIVSPTSTPTPTPRTMPRPSPHPTPTPSSTPRPTPTPQPTPAPTRQPSPPPTPTRQPTPSAIAALADTRPPAGATEPPPEPLPEPIRQFTDIVSKDWFMESVAWAYQSGIMNGLSHTKFAPMAPATADMLSSALARMLNIDLSEYSGLGNTLLTPSMAWANSIGIFEGIAKPSPYMRFARGQLMVMIVKFLNFSNADIPATFDYATFADSRSMSNDEYYAFQLLYHLKIIQGRGNGVMDPRTIATRGELAIVLDNAKNHIGNYKANKVEPTSAQKAFEPSAFPRYLLMHAPEKFKAAFAHYFME